MNSKLKRNSKQRTHFTREELLGILQCAKDESQRDFTIFLVLYKHCMRSQEVCNLTLGCIRPSITKMEELHIERLKGSLVTDQAITNHVGIPLLDEKRALREWLAIRPTDGGDQLFNTQKGVLRRETVSRLFLYYCQKASAKRVDDARAKGVANPETKAIPESSMFVHNLRHSRMQHQVGKMDLYCLKSLAGHRAISSTMVYLTPDQRYTMAEAQRVDMANF